MSIITRPGFRVAKCGHEYKTDAKQGRQRLYGECECKPKRAPKRVLGPCVVDQCPRKEKVRKMCTLHYNRWLRTGDVSDPASEKSCKFCELEMPLYEPNGRASIRKYCDDECKWKYRILQRMDFGDQEIAGLRVFEKQAAVDSYINKKCRLCSESFTPDSSLGQIFCSKSCSKRYYKVNNPNPCSEPDCDKPHLAQGLCSMHYKRLARAEGRYKNDPWSDRRRANHHKRRALKMKLPADDILPVDVYERDGWICGICGDSVDKSLKWPDPMSPSLDHIQPLSKGGHHVLSNVQLAHLECNVRKGDEFSLGVDEMSA